jgi:putative effector of murein hydrolase
VARRRPPSEVRQAASRGLAAGLQQHLPGTVGLVAKGIPLCCFAAFAHLVLGVEVSVTLPPLALALLGLSRWS